MRAMADSATAPQPSATFLELRHPRGFTLVREDFAAALRRTERGDADPFEYPFVVRGEIGGGRRPLKRIELEGAGFGAVFKVLRRGGVFGAWLGERALPSRARREAAVVATLARAAVPCVGLLAIRASRSTFPPWLARIELLTEPVEGGIDLLRFVGSCERSGRRRRHVLEHAGSIVAAMHDAGVFHVDLNLRNLLVTPADGVLLLDFGASRLGRVDAADRAENLARLLRSAVKNQLLGRSISRGDMLRFLRGYAPHEPRKWWSLVLADFRRTIGFHRAGWALSGIFRRIPGSSPRSTLAEGSVFKD